MSFWLPVAFICLSGGNCGFASGRLSVSIEQCEAQNFQVRRKLATNTEVAAFDMTCIEIKPKAADSL